MPKLSIYLKIISLLIKIHRKITGISSQKAPKMKLRPLGESMQARKAWIWTFNQFQIKILLIIIALRTCLCSLSKILKTIRRWFYLWNLKRTCPLHLKQTHRFSFNYPQIIIRINKRPETWITIPIFSLKSNYTPISCISNKSTLRRSLIIITLNTAQNWT